MVYFRRRPFRSSHQAVRITYPALIGRVLFLASFGISVFAADTFVGSQSCRPCHEQQHRAQSASGHARTLNSVGAHSLAEKFTSVPESLRRGRFLFSMERNDRGQSVKIANRDAAGEELEVPLDWAFGSGTHGVTFVSRIGTNTFLEHAFTYYSHAGTFDLTPGHDRLPAGTRMEAAGQTFNLSAISSCFQCHSTGPVSSSPARGIAVSEPGVRCEACHGPGSGHIATPSSKSIRNPKSLPPEEVLTLCGRCHRPPDGREAVNDFANPWNVRHQPPYLEQSKCFRASGKLTCFTCHSPHEPLQRGGAAYYSERCLGCHSGAAASLKPAPLCNAEPGRDCIRCHMPVVSANAHLRFRNHWIGVYRPAASLIPVR